MKGNEANANLHQLRMCPSLWPCKESAREGLLRWFLWVTAHEG